MLSIKYLCVSPGTLKRLMIINESDYYSNNNDNNVPISIDCYGCKREYTRINTNTLNKLL